MKLVGDDMEEKLLPIGTVVLLNGGTKKVMINGYYSKTDKNNRIYTYNGCIFPEGFMENIFCLFDRSDIKEICYMGYESKEMDDYLNNLPVKAYKPYVVSSSNVLNKLGGKI